MKRQKLCIVGAGSTYTLGMILSLIEEKEIFPLDSITFYDTDELRQETIAKATEILIHERYPELSSFTWTTNKEVAYKDVDFVFIQIRTGGLKMRVSDEKIPLKHHVVGQETCGPGGMAYGLRSIPDMIDIVNDIRKYSKDAWILNYTNPAAIVAEALKRQFPDDDRILNICDMPIAIMMSLAKTVNRSVWDIEAEYFGLNHFGWFTKITDIQGNDLTEAVKKVIIYDGILPEDTLISTDDSWRQTFSQVRTMLEDYPDYIPNTYLQYYLYPNSIVKKLDVNYVRSEYVIDHREQEVFSLANQIIQQGNLTGLHVEADVHGQYMVKAAASLAYNLNKRYIVITKNNGIIPNISSEAMVEVTAELTSFGVKPYALKAIPTFYKGLMENQYAYEALVVDAYFEKNPRKLLQALVLNRTVIDTELAKKILLEMAEVNEDYWGKWVLEGLQ